MTAARLRIAVMLALGSLGGSCAWAAGNPPLAGSLVGFVSDAAGLPQMGATVLLLNSQDRVVQRMLTNDRGAFGFDKLIPDVYSLRVSLASFVPAIKQRILVQPGMRSFLAINLSSVLSSIDLIYTSPAQGRLMSDDWKWVLRTSQATRPVLRVLPTVDISDPEEKHGLSTLFADTRGVLKLSAGDSGPMASSANPADLGTAFALSSVFGSNVIQLSGNLGYASQSGIPVAGFRTSFSHKPYTHGDVGFNPEVSLTVRQLFLPSRFGSQGLQGREDGVPSLKTMSVSVVDRLQVSDDLEVLYGFGLDSVTFIQRLNYVSPFARATYTMGDLGTVEFGYSSGAPPAALFQDVNSGREMQEGLSTLAMFPRVSTRDDRTQVQRTQNLEIGYRRKFGSRSISAGVFQESTTNAALTSTAPAGMFPGGEVLPDLFSHNSVFNIGGYSTTGYTVSGTQEFGEVLHATLAYGSGGVLRTESRELASGDPDDLRNMIRLSRRQWALLKMKGTVPWAGTRLTASYLWTDYRALTPGHTYLTQRTQPEVGFNVYIRQPIPSLPGMPGRLEATAELRNMMAQGYLPISVRDGQNFFMIHSPRAVRGGLSFIF